MLERFEFNGLPTRVVFGSGTINFAGDELRRLGAKRTLVLTTPQQKAQGHGLEKILGSLFVGVFSEATEHTPIKITDRALSVVNATQADCIVSLGGGSTVGLGKALALRTGLNQLCVPTTYAGSEMTPILGETEDGMKTTSRHSAVLPETVIYDVDLTTSLPTELTATSGMNAIAHAVEALYARDQNPVISLMAEEGVRVLADALPILIRDTGNKSARTDALYGAWLSGACLGSVGMSLHHKLCHTLGGLFNLPHATTHAILLPHALAYNAPKVSDALVRLRRALRTADPVKEIYNLTSQLRIARALKDIGMPEDGIELAADLAVKSAYWNPRPIQRDAIRDLLTRAWNGDKPESSPTGDIDQRHGSSASYRD
jgi:alcohol dehydrogenase class IV